MVVAPPESPAGGDEPPDGAVETLRNGHRRAIVAYLYEQDGEATLTAIAPRLADTTDSSFADAIAACYDLHLPKLEACGLVAYDRSGTVCLDADPGVVEEALARADGE